MKGLFLKLIAEQQAGNDTVLVSIVQSKGSTPRGKGAQMLVGKSGLLAGTIGGGPAEYDAIRLSGDILLRKKGMAQQYRLRQTPMENIDAVCGGELEVILCYIAADDCRWSSVAQDILTAIEEHRPGFLAIHKQSMEPYFMHAGELSAANNEHLYYFPLPIGAKVWIFGAGHCSAALTPLLASVGFRVSVLDNRRELLENPTFCSAEDCILCDFEHLSVPVSHKDYVIVMTSGHSFDYQVLRQILPAAPIYVGAIGSHRKAAIIAEKLLSDGFPGNSVEAIHSPIGLKIGAVTPEEIAVSIAGEMIQYRADAEKNKKAGNGACPMHC